MELLKKSNRVKRDADEILQSSKLLDVLSLYGDARIIGSYALNVMLRPDLDVYIVVQKHDGRKIHEVMSKIFALGYFQEIYFADWVNFHNSEKGKGYYIQLKVKLNHVMWKLDIWLIEEKQFKPYTEEFLDLIKKDPGFHKRRTILTIKEKLAEGDKYIKGVDGKVIYEAVLKHGVRTEKEFIKFLDVR